MPCRKNASEVVSDDNEIQDIDSTIGVEVGIYAITAGMSKNISVYATFLKSKDSPCFFALSDDVSRIIAAVVASTPPGGWLQKCYTSAEQR